MSSTLYRKYRPKNFSEVFGQNHIKVILKNEIFNSDLAHAYLFCGPRGTGKTTIARLLSKIINCENRKDKEIDACEECFSCKEIKNNSLVDIIEIDAASNTGVDNVRMNIIDASKISPTRAKFKVFIIDEVHMLSISSFNALLKVMEEPPSHVLFILCTTEIHKLPETIISRCERFDFKRLSISDIVSKLEDIAKAENINISKDVLQEIARKSEGHMRDAESILGQVMSLGVKNITAQEAKLIIPRSDFREIVNFLNALIKKDVSSLIRIINNLVDQGVDLKNFTEELIEVLRKIMLSKIDNSLDLAIGLNLNKDIELEVNSIIDKFDLKRIIFLLEKLNKIRFEFKDNFIIQMPLEILVLEFCQDFYTGKEETISIKRLEQDIVLDKKKTENIDKSKAVIDENETKHSKTKNSSRKNNFDFELLKSKWNIFLEKIKSQNTSLFFILNNSKIKLDDDVLILTFKYKFHKDRVSSSNIQTLIHKELKEIYNADLRLLIELDESLNLEPDSGDQKDIKDNKKFEDVKEDSKNVNDVLDVFGGEVIK